MSSTPAFPNEKRKHKRIPKAYTIHLRVLKANETTAWDMVLIKNIGGGGLLFDYPQHISPRTILIFKIKLELDEPAVECTGRVLRCDSADAMDSMFRIGVQFVEIAKKDVDRIDGQAEKFFAENL